MTQTPNNSAFTPMSALEAGLTRRELRRLVEKGAVRRLARGLYVDGRCTLGPEERAVALRQVISAHQVICDRTAAWLWGVDVYNSELAVEELPLEVVAVGGHARTTRPELLGRERSLADDEIVHFDGLRVTSPTRTLIDLLCRLPERSGLAAVDAFLRAGLVSPASIARQLPRHRGRRGIRRARPVALLGDARVESQGESFTRACIWLAGLPMPTPQYDVYVDGRKLYRLDLVYELLKIAIEYDGEEFHGEDQRLADQRRRKWLRQHGWYVIVVRKDQLSSRGAEPWLSELARVMRERTDELARYSRIDRRRSA